MSETIDDIRAILRDFVQSPWRDLFVSSDDWQLFLARPDGGTNPLKAQHPDAQGATHDAAASGTRVPAPHLGIFRPDCRAGDVITEGTAVGRIAALDRETPVLASASGTLGWVESDGAFVEFGAQLAEISTP